MSLFENKHCPVCDKEFLDGDDIVVCPECGTPHHRECYKLIGHCVNRGLHKADYDYNEDNKPFDVASIKTASEESNDYHSDKKEEAPNSFPNPFIIPELDAQFENDREKIGGEDISDIASTVRVNAPRYISVFKKLEKENKKANWNWSGFFFGSFFLLYRKLYRLGIAFYSLALALFFGANALMYKFAPEFMAATRALAEAAAQKVNPTNEQFLALSNCADSKIAVAIFYGMIGVILIFHIIIALYADSYYKKQVIEIVSAVKKQLDDGASFTQSSLMMGGELNMTQEQMKRMYLSRKGGTSFMAPALALMLLSFILY